MKPNISVKIGKLQLNNPVMVASGTFGYGEEFKDFVDINKLGAFVTKTITKTKREGNAAPRICETSAGMLNAIGLQNEGVEDFIKNKLKIYKGLKSRLVVSVGGRSNDEYVDVVRTLNGHREVSAIELNISCPNVKYDNKIFSQDEKQTYSLVSDVRRATDLPLIVKLSPNVTDISGIALSAEEAGADAISLVNTFLGMAVDAEKRAPVLGNVTGGLSGPAIKPIALYMIWQVKKKIKLPIIGMGGIMNARDAIEFIIAGATAVAVGTANFVNPCAPLDIIDGIKDYLKNNSIEDINKLTGSLNV